MRGACGGAEARAEKGRKRAAARRGRREKAAGKCGETARRERPRAGVRRDVRRPAAPAAPAARPTPPPARAPATPPRGACAGEERRRPHGPPRETAQRAPAAAPRCPLTQEVTLLNIGSRSAGGDVERCGRHVVFQYVDNVGHGYIEHTLQHPHVTRTL